MSGAVFLDFRKAFDLVHHDILLKKLFTCNLSIASIAFLRSYLRDRLQCMLVNGTYSQETSITSGVPQGSISFCFVFKSFSLAYLIECLFDVLSVAVFADTCLNLDPCVIKYYLISSVFVVLLRDGQIFLLDFVSTDLNLAVWATFSPCVRRLAASYCSKRKRMWI